MSDTTIALLALNLFQLVIILTMVFKLDKSVTGDIAKAILDFARDVSTKTESTADDKLVDVGGKIVDALLPDEPETKDPKPEQI